MKHAFCILLALILAFSLGTAVFASSEASSKPVDRPEPEVIEGERYVSDHLYGASAVYVSGETVSFDDAYFYGAGYATDEEIDDQIPNQYGYASVVVACGQGTDLTLNNPTIESDPESYANGIFAAAMAKVTVNGGTITTDNSSGHGIDATFMGHVYAYDTVIHTSGGTSGALATDFGGGFIQGERIEATTEAGSSPAIFCAGSTIIMLKDSSLTTETATGIVVAHDHAVVVLDNCEVNAAGTVVSGLQALPSPESSDGSCFYAFNSTLTSAGGAVVGEGGGRTVVNLVDCECTAGGDTAVSCSDGILTVNLWGTELVGNITCADGSTLIINIYDGGRLTGNVTDNVEVNVYDGGEFDGEFVAAEASGEASGEASEEADETAAAEASGEANIIAEAGEEKPVVGSFDDYLTDIWAGSSINWTESRAAEFTETIEPTILANSAACYVTDGAAAVAYDSATYNPSENGIDLSLLNVSGAHGFSVAEVFGSASGEASK